MYIFSRLALISDVTLDKKLIFSAETVTLASLLRSLASALTAVVPIIIESICTAPETFTLSADKVIKSVSVLCPILAPLITTSSTDNLPAVISLVPTSILPNVLVIEPLSNGPTFLIRLLPAFGAYNPSAVLSSNLDVICAWIFDVTSVK